MITNINKLKSILERNRLRPTYQRLKVMEYLEKGIDTHPTAQAIFEAVVSKVPTISLTTVYNTLDILVKNNIVRELTITGTETRYDITTASHHHFLCRECGRIYDIDIPCQISEKRSVNGHQIDEIHGYFKGICKNCLSVNKKSKHK